MRHTIYSVFQEVKRINRYNAAQERDLSDNRAARDVAAWVETHFTPLSMAPRHVFEWATEHKWDDFDRFRQNVTDLGESASIDLCNARRWISQMMDWVATHMMIDPDVCFRCHEKAVAKWNDFPLCIECHKRASNPKPVKVDIDRAQSVMDAIFSKTRAPRPVHRETCSNRRLRHSYVIRIPAGFLKYDGTFAPDMHLADKWTKDEVEIERAAYDDLGTPISIYRVVK